MNDQIWIGNSVYPREFLVALAIAAILAAVGVAFAAAGIRWLVGWLTYINNRD
ncbi:hypothetical protein [Bradyrhizobium ottawaense]|uniref:hypothetical protein n=1 Tax=Bradyrhizobium ottawaense TaxID=931866 RepID=UPI0015CEF5E8|nr:hypothetical protein [Bradyrhizobium ottawaense]